MSKEMGTAEFVKQMDGWRGDAALYRLSPPMAGVDGWAFDHVIVSAVIAIGSGPETYLFGCDENGENIDFSELPGSFRGDRDHATALNGAGYSIVSPE